MFYRTDNQSAASLHVIIARHLARWCRHGLAEGVSRVANPVVVVVRHVVNYILTACGEERVSRLRHYRRYVVGFRRAAVSHERGLNEYVILVRIDVYVVLNVVLASQSRVGVGVLRA